MTEMRILTVRQPWAWAIIHGGKHVENRVRNIAGDYRGPVAIHVGLAEDKNAFSLSPNRDVLNDAAYPVAGMPWWENYGHIIGVVNLWAVHQHDGSKHFLCCPNAPDKYQRWAEPDAWHLCIASQRQLAEPIPFKGALGLRRLDEETIALITAQLENES